MCACACNVTELLFTSVCTSVYEVLLYVVGVSIGGEAVRRPCYVRVHVAMAGYMHMCTSLSAMYAFICIII